MACKGSFFINVYLSKMFSVKMRGRKYKINVNKCYILDIKLLPAEEMNIYD